MKNIGLRAYFRILDNDGNPANTEKFENMSSGGYELETKLGNIGFDWEDYDVDLVCDSEAIFEVETSRHIPEYWEEEWKTDGIDVDKVNAKTLAEATEIFDFYVDWTIDDKGCFCSEITGYKLNLLSMMFNNGVYSYRVADDVIERFNKESIYSVFRNK